MCTNSFVARVAVNVYDVTSKPALCSPISIKEILPTGEGESV